MSIAVQRTPEMTLAKKIWQINWTFVFLITVTASVGFVMLYSAANGHIDPWASRQMARFGVGLTLMLVAAVIDIRFWLRYAYIIFFLSVGLLVAVEVIGTIGMGAQRWINLGVIRLQPSEMVKVTLILALARYFYASRPEDLSRVSYVLVPLILIAVPVFLVIRQPDLGTALMLLTTGVVMLYIAGTHAWMFIAAGAAALAAAFPVWKFVLFDYQKQRVLTYLSPETDPLGAGYHILQSKIALGSGGVFGKGFLQGTQSHLNFLPEKQTDFIYTMMAEEFGMVGALALLGLYTLLIIFGFAIAFRSRNQFGRLIGLGVTTAFFLNVFVNIGMVTGLLPVVGMPLPLISYGGSSMLTLLFGFGLLLCAYVHRDINLGPGAASSDM